MRCPVIVEGVQCEYVSLDDVEMANHIEATHYLDHGRSIIETLIEVAKAKVIP